MKFLFEILFSPRGLALVAILILFAIAFGKRWLGWLGALIASAVTMDQFFAKMRDGISSTPGKNLLEKFSNFLSDKNRK